MHILTQTPSCKIFQSMEYSKNTLGEVLIIPGEVYCPFRSIADGPCDMIQVPWADCQPDLHSIPTHFPTAYELCVALLIDSAIQT